MSILFTFPGQGSQRAGTRLAAHRYRLAIGAD
ncbi:MAG: hypothetical protein RLZZ237_2664, partial [Pseudomonadota bacterium]